MNNYEIIRLRDRKEQLDKAANWFHMMWGIPEEAYRESMEDCLKGNAVPQWYIAVDGESIIGGLGVIENDFHPRKDLAPNVCAVYVDEAFRGRGIAGRLLNFACEDMHDLGIDTLYLLANRTGFYEQYGWEYLCMVEREDKPGTIRMYIHQ